MSQITIFSLYLLTAGAFTASRHPRFASRSRPLHIVAFLLGATGAVMHGQEIFGLILPRFGFDLTIGNAVALIGLELAVIGLLAALEPTLRGISGGLIFLAALTVLLMGPSGNIVDSATLAWQVRAHVLIALLSYGLLWAEASARRPQLAGSLDRHLVFATAVLVLAGVVSRYVARTRALARLLRTRP